MPHARTALAATLLSVFNTAHADTVVWDQGPASGSYAGWFSNSSSNQNFADFVQFSTDTTVDGLNYFTEADLSSYTSANAFHLRIYDSVHTGDPNYPWLYSTDLGFTSYTAGLATQDNHAVNQLHFDFTPFAFAANTRYWVGLSGNNFDAAQALVRAPQDGQIAVFSGDSFILHNGTGDQMFQLTVSSVPEPETYAMLLAGLGVLGFMGKRRRAS